MRISSPLPGRPAPWFRPWFRLWFRLWFRPWFRPWFRLSAGIAALLFCVANPFSSIARAQEKTATITLGSDTAMAGGTVVIPIAFHAKEGVKIKALSVEILVPDKFLRLRAARTSLGTELAGGEVKTEQSPAPEKAGLSILKVTVTAQKALPTGVLATLEFRLAEQVGDTSKLVLQSSKATVTTVEGQTLTDVEQRNGEVAISKTPPAFVGCFFFTH